MGTGASRPTHEPHSLCCVPGRDLAISTGQPTFSRLLNIGNSANRKSRRNVLTDAYGFSRLLASSATPHPPRPLLAAPVVHRVATYLTILVTLSGLSNSSRSLLLFSHEISVRITTKPDTLPLGNTPCIYGNNETKFPVRNPVLPSLANVNNL